MYVCVGVVESITTKTNEVFLTCLNQAGHFFVGGEGGVVLECPSRVYFTLEAYTCFPNESRMEDSSQRGGTNEAELRRS